MYTNTHETHAKSCTEELHIEAPAPLADATLLWFCLNDENTSIILCSKTNGLSLPPQDQSQTLLLLPIPVFFR